MVRTGVVGLVTGCFDIIHIGHIHLFQFAKKHVDYLIVGLEQDETIRLTKWEDRPIHNIKIRTEILQEVRSIDEIFHIKDILDYKENQKKSEAVFTKMLKQISPSKLITATNSDKFRKQKQFIAEKLWIQFIPFQLSEPNSSSKLIQKIGL